jgi:sirohydrochlorin cobaltochelatase
LSAKSGIVLFAHGSRDPEWAAPFRAIERKLTAADGGSAVALAFLEIMQPTFEQAVDRLVGEGCGRITIAPLFMAQGAHLKRDLAKLVAEARARHPQVDVVTLAAAGEANTVMDAVAEWISASVKQR